MHHELVLLGPGGAAVLVALVGLLVWRRHAGRAAAPHVAEPRSLVQLLTSDEEIAGAARRAASFEHQAAQRATARAVHYEALADAPASPIDATVHDLGQRSAS